MSAIAERTGLRAVADRTALAKALAFAARVVPSKTTKPILEHAVIRIRTGHPTAWTAIPDPGGKTCRIVDAHGREVVSTPIEYDAAQQLVAEHNAKRLVALEEIGLCWACRRKVENAGS